MYRSPIIIRKIKSIRLRLVDHLVRMEESRSAFRILTGKLRDLQEGIGVDGRTILEWILQK